MQPRELSDELRNDSDNHLRRRRTIVGLSFLASQCMELVGLYQMGMIDHVPEPPIDGFDADAVDASDEAYAMLNMPDGFIGLTSYAVTAGLAAAGGRRRAEEQPLLPIAMAGKAFLDAAQAAKLTCDQWTKHRAFCFWCLVAAGATFATVPLALPEAKEAMRHLRSGNGRRR